jgi:hypothetical protein
MAADAEFAKLQRDLIVIMQHGTPQVRYPNQWATVKQAKGSFEAVKRARQLTRRKRGLW